MNRQIISNIIAGRQLDHCVYKMPPQTEHRLWIEYSDIILPYS